MPDDFLSVEDKTILVLLVISAVAGCCVGVYIGANYWGYDNGHYVTQFAAVWPVAIAIMLSAAFGIFIFLLCVYRMIVFGFGLFCFLRSPWLRRSAKRSPWRDGF